MRARAHWLWYVAAALAIVAAFVSFGRDHDTWLAIAYLAAGVFLFSMGDLMRKRGQR